MPPNAHSVQLPRHPTPNKITWAPLHFLISHALLTSCCLHAHAALQAIEFYRKGVEYIVMNGEVVIVDEATGRLRLKSRWEDGIHQAVEAKERVLQVGPH